MLLEWLCCTPPILVPLEGLAAAIHPVLSFWQTRSLALVFLCGVGCGTRGCAEILCGYCSCRLLHEVRVVSSFRHVRSLHSTLIENGSELRWSWRSASRWRLASSAAASWLLLSSSAATCTAAAESLTLISDWMVWAKIILTHARLLELLLLLLLVLLMLLL